MPSGLGIRPRDHDLVPFAGADLVVAARAPVELHSLVGLRVAHVYGFRLVIGPATTGPGISGPGMVRHRGSGSAGGEAPGDECGYDGERDRADDDVTPTPDLLSEGIQAHGDTVSRWRPSQKR